MNSMGSCNPRLDGAIKLIQNGTTFRADFQDVVWFVDDEACRQIISNFTEAKQDPNFGGLLVDVDFGSSDPSRETRAYGWIVDMEYRSDGLYVLVLWTKSGRPAIEGGDYQFLVPRFDLQSATKVRTESSSAFRPAALNGATVSNVALIAGAQPLARLCNREFRAVSNRVSDANLPEDVESESVFSPEQSEAKTCFDLASKAQKEKGGNFTDHWNAVRAERSMANDRSAIKPTTNRETSVDENESRRKAALILGAALQEQAVSGVDFESAWNRVLNRDSIGLSAAESLKDLEPRARDLYLKICSRSEDLEEFGEDVPTALVKPFLALAATNPNLDAFGRWKKLRETNSNVFWEIVQKLAEASEDLEESNVSGRVGSESSDLSTLGVIRRGEGIHYGSGV